MKYIVVIFFVFLCMSNTPVYAAFPVGLGNVQAIRVHSPEIPQPVSKKKEIHRTGWQGIVSLVCGILGLVPLTSSILLAACAILFGWGGLNKKKHKNTGFAIAGIMLGVVDVVFWVLLISSLGIVALV